MDPVTGGPAQGVRTSIATMDAMGIGCVNEVVCLDDPGSAFIEDDAFTTHVLGRGSGPWRRNPALGKWLRENLGRFDAVIVHGLWQYPSYAVTNTIRSLRAKGSDRRSPRVFVMPHGMLDPWFQRDRSRRIKAVRNWLYWKLLEQRTISSADGLLFTCQKELELARTTFRPYRPRLELNVGYGVAEPPAHDEAKRLAFREKVPSLGQRPYLLYLSRIHPKKGVDLLIRAYAGIAEERARSGARTADLVIAGPLDSAYGEAMQELARHEMSGLPATCGGADRPTVHFPGMLSGDSKWGAFYGCEAFVLPSHQENFGIAVVEALACGKPVLISDQVNICDEISSAAAGCVESDDAPGVAALLERFLALDDIRKAAMSAASLSCYKANFAPETAARNLIAAVKQNPNMTP